MLLLGAQPRVQLMTYEIIRQILSRLGGPRRDDDDEDSAAAAVEGSREERTQTQTQFKLQTVENVVRNYSPNSQSDAVTNCLLQASSFSQLCILISRRWDTSHNTASTLDIQGWILCCAPGSVNMRRENCVFPACCMQKNAIFYLIFMEARAHHKVHPCSISLWMIMFPDNTIFAYYLLWYRG